MTEQAADPRGESAHLRPLRCFHVGSECIRTAKLLGVCQIDYLPCVIPRDGIRSGGRHWSTKQALALPPDSWVDVKQQCTESPMRDKHEMEFLKYPLASVF